MSMAARNNVSGNNGAAMLAMTFIQDDSSRCWSMYLPPSALLMVKKIKNTHMSVETSKAAPKTLVEDGGRGGRCCDHDDSLFSLLSVVVSIISLLTPLIMPLLLCWLLLSSISSREFSLFSILLLLCFFCFLRLRNDRCLRYTTHAALVVIELGGGVNRRWMEVRF